MYTGNIVRRWLLQPVAVLALLAVVSFSGEQVLCDIVCATQEAHGAAEVTSCHHHPAPASDAIAGVDHSCAHDQEAIVAEAPSAIAALVVAPTPAAAVMVPHTVARLVSAPRGIAFSPPAISPPQAFSLLTTVLRI